MTEQELQDLRHEKWHLDASPIRTLEDARSFIEAVGFCLLYPHYPPVLAPTFLGAWVGSNEKLPAWQQAFSDPRAQSAIDLMIRLLRERDAFETNRFEDNNPFLLSASIFPYFYALVGERNPKHVPKPGHHSEYSQLACDAFEVIRRAGPISKQKMQETLGKSISIAALDRALSELGAKLRIIRVDYDSREGSSWDVLYRWAPDLVREGMNLSVGEALSALLSKYLDCVIAADQHELDNFFGNFVPRSRVKESVNALLNARGLEYCRVGNRTLVQIAAPAVSRIASPKPYPVEGAADGPPRHTERKPGFPSSAKPEGL